MNWFLLLFCLSSFVFLYHHIIYPYFIKAYAANLDDSEDDYKSRNFKSSLADASMPIMTIIMPIYNEEKSLEAKLTNILSLDYPPEKLQVSLGLDGCTDNSVSIVNDFKGHFSQQGIKLHISSSTRNMGKVAVLNSLFAQHRNDCDIYVLTDVSALVSLDALQIIAHRMLRQDVGVVTGDYQLYDEADSGESQYWTFQRAMRKAESKTGSVIGPPGALYALKANLATEIPLDTINDDFVFPMNLVNKGYRAVLDERINIIEMESTSTTNDLKRRVRIGAGNLQQTLALKGLFTSTSGLTGFNFISGKFLRLYMPVNLIVLFASSFILISHPSVTVGDIFIGIFSIQAATYISVLFYLLNNTLPNSKVGNAIFYLISGYFASFYGGIRFIFKLDKGRWIKIPAQTHSPDYQITAVTMLKRMTDIVISVIALVIFLPIFPLVAIAIKLDTPGPVFYRQLRVGEMKNNYVEVFMLIKFRTMGLTSEKGGAVWATKDDNRGTKVGSFLRKSRLDEIPQLINVLVGNMAIVGPRPERPIFCGKLEECIPYYLERTSGVRPGITGLAQVNQSADTCIEDVENKLYWDHAYALTLISVSSWIKSDLNIIGKTFLTMVRLQGH